MARKRAHLWISGYVQGVNFRHYTRQRATLLGQDPPVVVGVEEQPVLHVAAGHVEDLPHLEFCGYIALLQIRRHRFLFADNPWPTWLTHVEPRPRMFNHPSVRAPIFDQCRLGLKSARGRPVKKPSAAICNAEEFAKPFMNLR